MPKQEPNHPWYGKARAGAKRASKPLLGVARCPECRGRLVVRRHKRSKLAFCEGCEEKFDPRLVEARSDFRTVQQLRDDFRARAQLAGDPGTGILAVPGLVAPDER